MNCKQLFAASVSGHFGTPISKSKAPLSTCTAWAIRRFSAAATMASEQSSKPLKHHSVVSSFIIKFDSGKPSVALFRRSDKVNTYQ